MKILRAPINTMMLCYFYQLAATSSLCCTPVLTGRKALPERFFYKRSINFQDTATDLQDLFSF
jgi:hypothetical protein